ncbi:unnamed protein product [Protopolystoma xenopodis]|uniref:Uncharacterized protein n=1 Tax=Protopolystoma xenopodis TaxID=117903 RepID=A0A448WS89_9PLAT|nr:unnamed protein product [Protopolystoma xenopodis]
MDCLTTDIGSRQIGKNEADSKEEWRSFGNSSEPIIEFCQDSQAVSIADNPLLLGSPSFLTVDKAPETRPLNSKHICFNNSCPNNFRNQHNRQLGMLHTPIVQKKDYYHHCRCRGFAYSSHKESLKSSFNNLVQELCSHPPTLESQSFLPSDSKKESIVTRPSKVPDTLFSGSSAVTRNHGGSGRDSSLHTSNVCYT